MRRCRALFSSMDPPLNPSRVKQGCVLAHTLFGILFSLLLGYALKGNEEGVYIHTRSDGSLFNLSRLLTKTKVRKVMIREMLFADDAALTAHTEAGLQDLINCFSNACNVSSKRNFVRGNFFSLIEHCKKRS